MKKKIIKKQLIKNVKNHFEKRFFQAYEQNYGKSEKNRYIKLVTTDPRRNYSISGPNYHAIIFFQKIY